MIKYIRRLKLLEAVAKAALESLKQGAHAGPCTNEGCEYDCACDRHVQATRKRQIRLRKALAAAGFQAKVLP